MINETAVMLSRWQFALTASYHFLFVPLTLGLAFLLAIMETIYVITKRPIWKEMTKFWGLLFGINFAMGVATGITMEFQFGTNWAYYSQYVGDIFGSILAIEGLMAFFLEASLIGVFFFGWNRLSPRAHLISTWFLAIGTSLSALWILIANGWMQNPVGATFNPLTMRMELTSLYDVIFNPVAQTKFVHTVAAGYVTGAVFMVSVSCFYLFKKRHIPFAKRSMIVATTFGLASAFSVILMGDESGYTLSHNQKMKIAAIEAMWKTQEPPASLTLLGIPDMDQKKTLYKVEIPYLLGLIATRSLDQKVLGLDDLVKECKKNILEGQKAYGALQILKTNPKDAKALETFKNHGQYLGYGLLLKRFNKNVIDATEEQIQNAPEATVPSVADVFFAFRIMVGLGMLLLIFFIVAFWRTIKNRLERSRGFLYWGMVMLPVPWICIQSGWFVAEHGRQPWVIEGVLPTFLGASNVNPDSIWFTLIGFFVFYTALTFVDVFLMIKYIRLGPEKALQHHS